MHSTGFGRLEKGRRGTRGGLWRRKSSLHSNRFGRDRSPLFGELERGRRESLKAKLEHAQDLMSHVSRELEVVVERALDALIRELSNKRWGKPDKPRRSRGRSLRAG